VTIPLAIDTSVAVPLLVQTHVAHLEVVRWWDRREIHLSGHALAETYAVLTRLPGDLRLDPRAAAVLLAERFAPPLLLGAIMAVALNIAVVMVMVPRAPVSPWWDGGLQQVSHVRLTDRDHPASQLRTTVGL